MEEKAKRGDVAKSERSTKTDISLPGMHSKTLMNRSSLKTNIITGEENPYSGQMKPKIMDVSVFNRKKGISEFKDLMKGNCVNPDHQKAFQDNKHVFKRYNGIFTHLYNAAARFGETEVFKA